MNSLKKLLVVLVVIATGLGAAMLFRKQDADSEAGNASDAKAASAGAAPVNGESPRSKSQQAVPLPADGEISNSGANHVSQIPVPGGSPVAAAEDRHNDPTPPATPSIRTPPVLPPAFPSFQPREVAAEAAQSVEVAKETGASVDEPVGLPSRRALPITSEAGNEPTAPPSLPNRVTPPSPPVTVAPAPRPVEASRTAVNQPPQFRTHRIVNGDTLARIARRYLGSEDRGAEILELNRDVLNDPQMLPLGRVIKIPPRGSTSDANAATSGGTVLPLPPLVPLPPGAFARP